MESAAGLGVLAVIVAVPVPEFPSKNTASVDVGAEAPEEPPEVADQFAVLTPSQVPVPPTQYLFAILRRFLHNRGRDRRNPIVDARLFHLLNFRNGKFVRGRQMKRIPEQTVRRFRVKRNGDGFHLTPRE